MSRNKDKQEILDLILTTILLSENKVISQQDFLEITQKRKIRREKALDFVNEKIKNGKVRKFKKRIHPKRKKRVYYEIRRELSEKICSECLPLTGFYHCFSCGAKICQHLMKRIGSIVICADCSEIPVICPNCFYNSIVLDKSYETFQVIIVPIINGKEEKFVCLNEQCKNYRNPLSKAELDCMWYNMNIERLMELKEDIRWEEDMYEELEKQRIEFLKLSSPCIEKCEFEEDCLNGDCPLQFDDQDYCCPNGLSNYSDDCEICEECEYYHTDSSLDPRDNECTTTRCEWMDIAFPEEEE